MPDYDKFEVSFRVPERKGFRKGSLTVDARNHRHAYLSGKRKAPDHAIILSTRRIARRLPS